MTSKFANLSAVITGGSTGIGFATAKLLVSGGARVLITARDRNALDAAVRELGERARGQVSDASVPAQVDALAATAKAWLGEIDFLFVNAGIAKFAPLEQVTEQFYDEQFAINTRGAYFTVQKLAPLLRDGAGVVLNTSVVDELGMPTTSVYAATKAALRSMTRTLAAELLPRGIRVNSVSPGPVATPIYPKLGMPAEMLAGFEAQMRDGNPMKRFGKPEEVAHAALYLGLEATYTTGAELPVDGGLTQL